jgi:roadblock/LC7 domain-containing protein
MEALHYVHTANAWKAFLASALASLVLMGVAVDMGVQTHRDMERSEWISEINAAIANGTLAACQNGGICAYVDKKWVRLDR